MNLSEYIECDLGIERVENCLFSRYTGDWSYNHKGYMRNQSALYYIADGVFDIKINGVPYTAGPDSILMLDFGVYSSMKCREVGSRGTLDIYQLCFLTNRKFSSLGLPLCIGSQKHHLRSFMQIYAEWSSHSLAYRLKTRSMIGNLLYSLTVESAAASYLRPVSMNLMKLLTYIHANYMKPLTSEDLSRVINYSPSHIRRLFASEFSMTPVKYINKVRVEKARELLFSGSLPVNRIAEMVGYDNPAYFSRVFRQVVGMTPHEYRLYACDDPPVLL